MQVFVLEDIQGFHGQLSLNLYSDYSQVKGHWTQVGLASVANYNFDTYHKSGKMSVDAYALSRLSWGQCIKAESVQAVLSAVIQAIGSPIEEYPGSGVVLEGLKQDTQNMKQMSMKDQEASSKKIQLWEKLSDCWKARN